MSSFRANAGGSSPDAGVTCPKQLRSEVTGEPRLAWGFWNHCHNAYQEIMMGISDTVPPKDIWGVPQNRWFRMGEKLLKWMI